MVEDKEINISLLYLVHRIEEKKHFRSDILIFLDSAKFHPIILRFHSRSRLADAADQIISGSS